MLLSIFEGLLAVLLEGLEWIGPLHDVTLLTNKHLADGQRLAGTSTLTLAPSDLVYTIRLNGSREPGSDASGSQISARPAGHCRRHYTSIDFHMLMQLHGTPI